MKENNRQAASVVEANPPKVKQPRLRHPAPELIGKEYTWLTVIRFDGWYGVKKKAKYIVRCKCGKEYGVWYGSLKCGDNTSCGCRKKLMAGIRSTTHGQHRRPENGGRSVIYQTWDAMVQRCENPSNLNFKHYGGRGIKICGGLRTFEGFSVVMGERPEGKSMDREKVNGSYACGECEECKSNGWDRNVRWADWETQCNNKRTSRPVTHNGRTMPIKKWAKEFGFKEATLYGRIFLYDWTPEEAFTTPAVQRRDYSKPSKRS